MSISRLFNKLRSPTYTNSGSTARDHLASERTFLAWLRTGLGFIALGIAIERFSTLEPLIQHTLHSIADQHQQQPNQNRGTSQSSHSTSVPSAKETRRAVSLSTAFTSVGSGSILYGTHRYVTNLRLLQRGLYRPGYWGIGGFVLSVVGMSGYGIWDTYEHRNSK